MKGNRRRPLLAARLQHPAGGAHGKDTEASSVNANFAVLLSSSLASAAPAGMPFLSPLFSDNMVLQRGVDAPVWGWTDPGAAVTVSMNGKSARATAGADGKWVAKLGSFAAGGPYTLSVSGPETTVLHNVLVGDVWVCSGQSNMEFGIGNGVNAKEEIAAANYPQIRLFTVAKAVALTPRAVLPPPRADLTSQWSVCTPETIATGGWNGFTAVGYFFGRYLYQKLGVPIGLIHTSWGGTPAEAWTSGGALKTMQDYQPAVARLEQAGAAQADEAAVTKQLNINQNSPTVLYNGMIAPLLPYAMKGVIWYQGESNAGKAYQYRTLLPTMIRDWRSHWGEGAFPFLIVQLANFMPTKPEPADDAWAELREAQSMTAQSTPHTGEAVIIDIGDANDIHPKNKQDVGKRLALIALATVYHQRIEYS
ncbi:MAG: sialate O-acetylesterase, partial [Chloroflexi bacterium]|nr:sialate O-acetylesterase [Chloroflexota bacterium]